MAVGDDDRADWLALLKRQATESEKSWGTAFCLSLFLGFLGADRFYLGYAVLGILKLCTFGGLGVWWAFDVILIAVGMMKESGGRVLRTPFHR